MPHTIETENREQDEKRFLAQVLTEPPHYGSLFVRAPAISDNDFHTDSTGQGLPGSVENCEPLENFHRGDYVHLIYEPYPDYIDKDRYEIARVERAQVTEPEGYETIGESDIPIVCPDCGRKAAAVLKEGDKFGRAYSQDADKCHPSDERLAWFDIKLDRVYVHGI